MNHRYGIHLTTFRRLDYHNKKKNSFFRVFWYKLVTILLVQCQELINTQRQGAIGNAWGSLRSLKPFLKHDDFPRASLK